MFTTAQDAIKSHPKLQQVVIMEHAPRHDTPEVDPTGLKSKLAVYANSYLAKLLQGCSMKDRIMIGKHSLDHGVDQRENRYRDDWTGRYDGVHFFNSQGRIEYTISVGRIIKSAILTPHSASSSS